MPYEFGDELPVNVVSATDLARNTRHVRDLAAKGPVLVTRAGRPVAVVVADEEVLADLERHTPTVSVRELNRGSASAVCLDAAEASQWRVLTDTNRKVAAIGPVEVFRRRLAEAAEAAFDDADATEAADAPGAAGVVEA